MKKISFYFMLFVACITMSNVNAQFNNPVDAVWTSSSYYYPDACILEGNNPYWLVDPEKYVYEINVPGATSITVTLYIETTIQDPYYSEGMSYIITENPWTVTQVGNYVNNQSSYSPSWNWRDTTSATFTIANGSKISLNSEILGAFDAYSLTYFDIEYTANY